MANRYYQKYKTLRAHVFWLLNHISEFKEQLKPLMVENFQLVSATIMPGQT